MYSFVRRSTFSILLIGLMCTYFAHVNSEDGSGFGEDEDIARKNSPGRTQKNICFNNVIGCTCNGKHEHADCSCVTMGLTDLRLTNVRIPQTIATIRIKDCQSVVLDAEQLFGIDIKLLNVSNVNHLNIENGNLRKVDKLILENVKQLDDKTEAFDQLEADTVIFKYVNFPTGKEFRPKVIKSTLKIIHCNLTNFEVSVDSQTTDRSIVMDHNYLDRVKLKIHTADFQMKGNHFIQLSSESSGLMDVEYSRLLNLEHNHFGKNNHINVMPQVSSSNQSLVFNVSMPLGLTNDSKLWLEHFKLIFTGQANRTHKAVKNQPTPCDEQDTIDSKKYRVFVCSDVKKLEEQLKITPTNKVITDRPYQPEKQQQKQKPDEFSGVSAANHIQTALSLIVTGVMISHKVSFF